MEQGAEQGSSRGTRALRGCAGRRLLPRTLCALPLARAAESRVAGSEGLLAQRRAGEMQSTMDLARAAAGRRERCGEAPSADERIIDRLVERHERQMQRVFRLLGRFSWEL